MAGWLLKYLISSSKVAANEVFAALTNETLHEGEGEEPLCGGGGLSRGLLGNFWNRFQFGGFTFCVCYVS